MNKPKNNKNEDRDIEFFASIVDGIFANNASHTEEDMRKIELLSFWLNVFFRHKIGNELKNNIHRIDGILEAADFKPTPDMKVNPELFTTQEEHDLYNALLKHKEYIKNIKSKQG